MKLNIVGQQLTIFGDSVDAYSTAEPKQFRIIRRETRIRDVEYGLVIDTKDADFISQLKKGFDGNITDYIAANLDELCDGNYNTLHSRSGDDEILSISELQTHGWTLIIL